MPILRCPGFGAAYGTAKAGVGIASMGVLRPELVMKSIVPIVMAGVLGIYGLIISVIISTGSEPLPPSTVRLMQMRCCCGNSNEIARPSSVARSNVCHVAFCLQSTTRTTFSTGMHTWHPAWPVAWPVWQPAWPSALWAMLA